MTIALKSIAIVAASTIALAACTQNPDGTTGVNRTTTGAVAGAVAGGILGATISDNKRRGAAVGAVAGGVAGGVIGNVLDAQERALEEDLAGSGAQIENTGQNLVVTLPESITFDFDSAVVKPSFRDDLIRLSQNLQEFPNSRVEVTGHTDNVGDEAYNQALSERRALAVANVLRSAGVASSRIITSGVGEAFPVASNASASGQAQNRRVEVVITPTG
ncbi:MAG: OmpA family protein [Pseudomonadota bacterium]